MILLAAFLLSLLLAEITTTNGLHPKISSAAFFLLPARLWELLAGSILALYIRNHGHFHSVILNEFLSLLGLVLIVFSVLFFDSSTPTPSLILLIPVVGACLIILSATSGTSANKILSLPVIVGIGLISYSAYLWHQPILAFLRFFFAEELSNTFLLASLVLIFFAAFLSWRFVEAPFRDRQKFSSSGMFLAASLGICLFSSFGLFLNKSNGLLFSYSDFERSIYENFIDADVYTVEKFNYHRVGEIQAISGKKKVLLIGDSYAQDLVNALYESRIIDEISLTTFYIPATCGVIFSQRVDALISENEFCGKEENSFKNPELLRILSESDAVWLASRWKKKFLPLMGESLRNVAEYNPHITVFGAKYFDRPSAKEFRRSGLKTWSQVMEGDERVNFINEKEVLKKMVAEQDGVFVDTQRILCSGEDLCAVYDGAGLLSYDGGHLTRYGARKLGEGIVDVVIAK